jgi:hypothetical protein
VKHLATKEELQRLRVELILWIVGTNVLVGGAILSAMLYLNNQLTNQSTFLLQHWKCFATLHAIGSTNCSELP